MSDNDVQQLKRKVEELNTNVIKILGYLHNDTGTGEKGLIADFKELKIDFGIFKRKYEDKELIKNTKMAVYGGIGAGIVISLKYVISFVVEHFKF